MGTLKNSLEYSKKRCTIFDLSVRKGRVLLNDIDRNGHCNNARFLRECGFGRRDLWHNNGVWQIIKDNGGNLVVGSQTIRYRRELSFGEKYEMRTRLLCWDERAFYVEHRFVTQTKRHGEFINAIVIVKNTVLGSLGPKKIISKLPNLQETESKNPSMTSDIQTWIESNKHSSALLKNETK